ncbi:hypothetical protein ICE98_01202 [Lactococcus lactis]|nr:hypothetical protein [Lactococcus lactis]
MFLDYSPQNNPELEKYEEIKARLDEALESVPQKISPLTHADLPQQKEGLVNTSRQWGKIGTYKKYCG